MGIGTQPRARRAQQPPSQLSCAPIARPGLRVIAEQIGDDAIAATSDGVSRLLLTMDEAARVLSVGRDKVYGLLSRRELRSVLIGRSRRIPLRELEAYVERLLSESA